MNSTDKIRKLLRGVYREQGYLVIGHARREKPMLKIGDTVDRVFGLDLGARFLVDKAAVRDDWVQQAELIRQMVPSWTQLPNPRGGFFFKIVLDNKTTLTTVPQ